VAKKHNRRGKIFHKKETRAMKNNELSNYSEVQNYRLSKNYFPPPGKNKRTATKHCNFCPG
jgi:hypothetical protein